MDWLKQREELLKLTKKAVAQSVGADQLIIQSISAIEELDRLGNTLSRRLREWFELYSPEFSHAINDNEAFAQRITEKSKKEQLEELGLTISMGADLEKKDVDMIIALAKNISMLFAQRNDIERYLEEVMKNHCPNMVAVAGATIGARLLREAGSLKRLASIQSSTIQLYGAEKALFRHLKTGAKPPKYGHIINHPLITKSQEKGKVARALGDKISIACKVDYFKGEPIGEELRKGLEERFS